MIPILKFALAAAVSAAAIVWDVRHRRIPNVLPASLLLIGIVSAWANRGWAGLADGLLGATLAFAVFLIPYQLGGMGGGDVKLMAGFGALTGAEGVLPALLLVAAAGAVTAVFSLFCRRRDKTVPYAPAITIGGLLVTASQMVAW